MKDEFAFISKIAPIKTYQSSLVQGIGDDAAVYRGSEKMDEVVCVDTMVEGVHFRRDTLSPYQIGKKGLAINVSDLAAMGAIPAFYLVSIAIPSSWNEEELAEIYRGMDELATRYNMDLIGGDTVSTDGPLVLTVTVMGRVERNQAKYRHQANAGDVVFLTGYVGSSAAGLELLFDKGVGGEFTVAEQVLVHAHQEPTPHVEAGRILATFHERISLNDVSDGVASEANELAEASKVKVTIEADALPFHESMKNFSREKQLDWALFGGEDFVLIGTVAKEYVNKLSERFRKRNVLFFEIGNVEAGEPGVFLKDGQQVTRLEKHGYNHFQKRG
ncbi:thiamine-phosphate kinase [Halalkalibacter nanhaiisediminis]|uniref:Thiamine-monophosphate kinase n=1 Tax=Halalkalibacter nanhaiisediminis TaxID=688079 RepID=A0A562QD39_9BACI|nr:thiamine-phosphate kinase [Halalkalibacter nanhaiisediminis]TWI53946.1 thiamine-phosphate kinase [Halalkalibacter nanhaiisediminis]